MDEAHFERVVAQAIDELPLNIRRHIANVAILVEEWPDQETLDSAQVDNPADLFGFYSGIPLTARDESYGLVSPDTISIYRQPILQACSTDAEIEQCVRETVRHEIGHYFGLSDDRLEELGAY